jgi:hypothetical protein
MVGKTSLPLRLHHRGVYVSVAMKRVLIFLSFFGGGSPPGISVGYWRCFEISGASPMETVSNESNRITSPHQTIFSPQI